ncbi:MAG: sigma 54-interacting transcriptional regulator [Megasphaera sp.]|jgi:propionate catabolism operon transcriptional regulator|nr:sigma 54-interacting transcriptional regulator [Megasphaera sp.]MCH4218283.1 sigma 54-interacting transcriptional regulator [Megasphaera sp.]
MKKIAFLVADERMKKDIEHTLSLYTERAEASFLPATIVIIDFDHIVEQAQALIRQGARVIITNSGAHQMILQKITDAPILCLYSSTNDALFTLNLVKKYKKIHLLLNQHFIFNVDRCPKAIRDKLVIHPPYSIGLSHLELLKILHKIPVTADTVIVGCTMLPQISDIAMPIFPIRPNESTILSVYQYANELILSKQKDEKQLSLLSSILSHVEEGIILYDKDGRISHINKRACQFLNITETTQTIGPIFPLMDQEKPLHFKETILHRPPYTLVANSSPFTLDGDCHYILTIRDVTELQRLEKNVRYKLSKTGMNATHHFSDIRTTDTHMKDILNTATIMAGYDAPILIEGESGTGKELFAQSIHNASPRRNGPFVAVNCAALPPDLLESELFGYVSGAFTGARKEGKAGYFELAHGGTIFLDEINSMSLNIQSKLLRVLENKEIMRIGSDFVIPLDIRIISASNVDILHAVHSERFRRDLFFRLNTLTLTLPSLNDRKTDIVYLFSYFLQTLAGHACPIPADLKIVLEQHHWWGNIRELYSIALRYHIFGDSGEQAYQYLFDEPQTPAASLINKEELHIDMKQLHHEVDQLVIQNLLDQGYTKTNIASILNISRQSVFNKIKDR